jgi:predicted RNA methylase
VPAGVGFWGASAYVARNINVLSSFAYASILTFEVDKMHDCISVAESGQYLSLGEVCELLSISQATGRNWVKLGKLIPVEQKLGKTSFLREDVDGILCALTNGESKALNRRRNKKKINGLSLYESYIACAHNINLVNSIISEYETEITVDFVRAVLANISLQFVCEKIGLPNRGNVLAAFLQGKLDVGEYGYLIDDLLADKSKTLIFKTLPVLNKNAEYVQNEDTLGFVYISLTNIGKRKAAGAYYTPMSVVNKLVSHLTKTIDISGKKIYDPCCGSGNFLLTIGERSNTPELLYGQDIDLIAVQLARISFALKFGVTDSKFMYSHFTCADTLISENKKVYDIVIGNPPWGGELSKEQLALISGKYRTAMKRGVETYNLFTEYALSVLSEYGLLAFVLPEVILNVAAHIAVRNFLIDTCNFKFVCYLGNVFIGVQCPSIILCVEKSKIKTVGIREVHIQDECHSIRTNRQISNSRFNFHVSDELQDCLDAINGLSELVFLKNNASFALGIVTGDNTAYTSKTRSEGYEPVLKGSDVKKYRFSTSGTFIKFSPDNFQQVAPTEFYRAPEKLLYRFICETLVFAYDDKQTLSLNSCNILIPSIAGMNAKYILAILNSRTASFYFNKTFNSVKVLRSHIEQIPIPRPSDDEQKHIVSLANKLIDAESCNKDAYDEIDDCVMALYGLTHAQKDVIKKSVAKRNLFLF